MKKRKLKRQGPCYLGLMLAFYVLRVCGVLALLVGVALALYTLLTVRVSSWTIFGTLLPAAGFLAGGVVTWALFEFIAVIGIELKGGTSKRRSRKRRRYLD